MDKKAITSNFDGLTCTVGEEVIKINQSIDFKSAIEEKTSIGQVKEFKNAGHQQCEKDSVWMRIVDTESGDSEWISVNVWYQQKLDGVFGKKAVAPVKTEEKNEEENLPF